MKIHLSQLQVCVYSLPPQQFAFCENILTLRPIWQSK